MSTRQTKPFPFVGEEELVLKLASKAGSAAAHPTGAACQERRT